MAMKDFKKRLTEKCIEHQQEVIKQLQREIEDAQQQANEYGQPKDRYDAYRTKLMRQIELYAKQLDKAKIVFDTLHKIPLEKKMNSVEFGAIVTTNKQNLFISAGLGKISLDGKEYYAISPQVPVFKALSGKQKGDTVTFNRNNFKIKDVF
jgi:transcription elongation GreA/GreB family factor